MGAESVEKDRGKKDSGSRRSREDELDRKERRKGEGSRDEREREKGDSKDGYAKDLERSRERGKDSGRDHDRDRNSEYARDRDRGKMRERDYEKRVERERGREKDKDYERVKYREKEEKDRSKDREREKGKMKDRDRSKAKERDNLGEEDDRLKRQVKTVEDDSKESVPLSASVIEERISKMKEERLKKSSSDSEILAWVSKSRKLEDSRVVERQKASRLMKALEEQDNIDSEGEEDLDEAAGPAGEHLSGVKILHGLDKVLEGGTVVLTLKDKNILVNGDVNEDVDMLENVEIGEQVRRNAAYKAAKKGAGVYDDKFTEEALSEKKMLPQYDEQAEDEGVTLDASGRFSGEAEKKLEALRRRIQGNTIVKAYEDLNSLGRSTSDYFTTEEMLQFKKPRKKKALRKREKLDLDALEAEAKSTGLGASDLGSRKDQSRVTAKKEIERTEAQLRTEAYESALAKAQEASLALAQAETISVKEEDDVGDTVFGEDYEDLQRSLERARKLALSQREEAAGPQAIAIKLRSKSVEEPSLVSSESQENKVVITEMEEFVLGLQLNEETHRPDAEDVFMDEEQEEEEPRAHNEDATEAEPISAGTEPSTSAQEEGEEAAENMVQDQVIHEVVVGKGLSGALKLLQDRGALKETVEWGGRTMDKKKSKLVGILDNQGTKEIRIERTDEFGRIMTPKEAFRMLSHKFHGKGPGKAKLEKRMKQYQEDLKLKQMKASDTPSMSVERMREAQARLQTPYLVLSGHVKPGQTSDPRSGFATVEKDTPGSLTPMLGDRKVEHFLGIKRKDDSGPMGPPPAKKSKS
ncbi:SART-1 family [Wolffia australiana]